MNLRPRTIQGEVSSATPAPVFVCEGPGPCTVELVLLWVPSNAEATVELYVQPAGASLSSPMRREFPSGALADLPVELRGPIYLHAGDSLLLASAFNDEPISVLISARPEP